MRHTRLAVILAVAAVLALLPGSAQPIARGHTTSGTVSAFHCLAGHGGQAAVAAGSPVIIQGGWGTLVLGDQNTFLNVQTTIISVNDAPMLDVSDQWSAPVNTGNGWVSTVEYSTGVTLAQAGDQMRFTFALVFSRQFTEQLAIGGGAGPVVHEAGLAFGGTCTVTAE